MRRPLNENYLRSSLFGFEDALVSTTGMVVGISAGIDDKSIILLASLVTIAVEAISMGAGEFLSEEAVEELEKEKVKRSKPFFGAVIMLFSYAFGGMIPVLPVVILPQGTAIIPTIVFAFTGLFILGYVKGKVVKIGPLRSALEMLTIGGLAALIGVLVGFLLKIPA